MSKWQRILLTCIKMLIVVIMIGFVSACGGGDESNDNSIVVTDADGNVKDETGSRVVCMGCSVLKMIFDAANANYDRLQSAYIKGTPTLLMVAFAIWLALRLLKYVGSMSENNVSEVWNEILRKAFVCLICYFIVASPTSLHNFVNMFIMPIYMAFLDLGVKILEVTTNSSAGADGVSSSMVLFGETITVKARADLSCMATMGIEFSNKGFPPSFYNTLECMLKYLSNNLDMGGKFAKEAMAIRGNVFSWIVGLFVFLCFKVVKMCFVFYLVDSLFQMCIIIFLLPLFVIAYAFGPTRKWVTTAFNYIIGSSAFLMCFSVIIAMVTRGMIELVNGSPGIFNPDAAAAKQNLSIGLLCFVLLGFLIASSMDVSSQLTNAFIGGKNSSNFQKKLKAVAQMAAKGAWNVISGVLTWGASTFPNTMVSRFVNRVQGAKKKIDMAAGRK